MQLGRNPKMLKTLWEKMRRSKKCNFEVLAPKRALEATVPDFALVRLCPGVTHKSRARAACTLSNEKDSKEKGHALWQFGEGEKCRPDDWLPFCP